MIFWRFCCYIEVQACLRAGLLVTYSAMYLGNEPQNEPQNPDYSSLKDEEVLWLSQEKPSLYKMLVDRYQAAFLRKAQSIVKSPQEAEDIVQEAFVKIYFNAKKFTKQEGIEFKSWAYRVLVNVAITKYRKLKQERAVEFLDPVLYENLPHEQDLALVADAKAQVETVLARLPKPMARLVALYYLEDKPYKDIAAQEGLTIPALKMKLFRAKKMLREELTKK